MVGLDDKSVVNITGTDPERKGFGTGFVIFKDDDFSYVLTCAHVIDELVSEDYQDVEVEKCRGEIEARGEHDSIDLAVIKVKREGYLGPPIRLSPHAAEGVNFISRGWIKYIKTQKELQTLEGQIYADATFGGKGKGQRIKAWKIEINTKEGEENKLEHGCSGAPVFDVESGSSIGVISSKKPNDIQGHAVDISELLNVWADMPESLKADLTKNDGQKEKPLAGDKAGKNKSEFEFDREVQAFLVGIDTYQDGVEAPGNPEADKIYNLDFCGNDVEAFEKFLIEHDVHPNHIKKLVNKRETTRGRILKELETFIKTVNEHNNDPLVFIYFACHGFPYEEENYLVPYDCDKSNLKWTGISYGLIREEFLYKIKTRNLVVFLDSCHSGAWASKGKRGAPGYNPLKHFEECNNFHLIASCKGHQLSGESDGHGLFTSELLNLLQHSYEHIESATITTTNLLPPLVERVKQVSNSEQVPTANFENKEIEAIVIGKNLIRTAEEDARNKSEEGKRKVYLDRVSPFIYEQKPRLGVYIVDLLTSYINKGTAPEAYKNFQNKFDLYVNIYEGIETDDEIEVQTGGLLVAFDECKQRKSSKVDSEYGVSAKEAGPSSMQEESSRASDLFRDFVVGERKKGRDKFGEPGDIAIRDRSRNKDEGIKSIVEIRGREKD